MYKRQVFGSCDQKQICILDHYLHKLVDDLIATGGTLGACIELVGKMNAKVVGATLLIDLVGIKDKDRFSDINISSLIRY